MTLKFIVPLSDRKKYDNFLGSLFSKNRSVETLTSNNHFKCIILESSLSEYSMIETFHCEVILVENTKEDSIFQKYNRGLEVVGVAPEDVYIFIHEDVKILDKYFFQKIRKVFEEEEKVGVLGVVGTTEFTSKGGWWLNNNPETMMGHWYQGHPGGLITYNSKSKVGYFDNLVSVDGFFLAIRGKVLENQKFDEVSYPNAYHFYDVDFCFEALKNNWKIAIDNISLLHDSEGPMGNSWSEAYLKFMNKWRDLKFPVTINNFER